MRIAAVADAELVGIAPQPPQQAQQQPPQQQPAPQQQPTQPPPPPPLYPDLTFTHSWSAELGDERISLFPDESRTLTASVLAEART